MASQTYSSLLEGDAADAVAALKRDVEADLVVLGSGELVRARRRPAAARGARPDHG